VSKDTTFGLGMQQLADLLAMVAAGPERENGAPDEQTVGEALQKLLGEKLALTADVERGLASVVGRDRAKLLLAAGRSIGDLLLDPETDPALLHLLKEQRKAAISGGGSEEQRLAEKVAYFTAIASALVHHGRKITSYSYARLADDLTTLARKECLPRDVQSLLGNAAAVCVRRKPESGQGSASRHGSEGRAG